MPDRLDAIYARYSSHNQDGGTSIPVQLDACRQALEDDARRSGYTIAGPRVYVDEARTGTEMSRESMDELMRDAEAGKIRSLWVHKWDRFGRSAFSHGVAATFEKLGVRCISATEGEDAFGRDIHLAMGTHFSRVLSQRIRLSKRKRFEEGCWHGGRVPYGYRAEGNRLVPDPEESVWVADLFRAYVHDGHGFKALARRLERSGVRPRFSRHWSGDSIKAILRNPMYAGRVYHGRFRDPNRRTRLQAPESAAEASRVDESLRIVPDDLWRRVQERISERRNLKPAGRSQARLLTRTLKCGVCGGSCIRRYYKAGKSYDPTAGAYWACGTRIKVAKEHCTNKAKVDEEAFLERLTGAVSSLLADEEAVIAAALARLRETASTGRQEVQRVEREIAAADRRIEHLMKLLTDPDLSEPEVRRRLSAEVADESKRREALQQGYREIAGEAHNSIDAMTAAIRQALAEAREGFSAVADPAKMNQAVQVYFGAMTLNADGSVASSGVPVVAMPKPCHPRDILRPLFWACLEAA